jgi:hypothetical protein
MAMAARVEEEEEEEAFLRCVFNGWRVSRGRTERERGRQ